MKVIIKGIHIPKDEWEKKNERLSDKGKFYSDDVFDRYFNRKPFSGDVTRDIFLKKADRVVKKPKPVSPFQREKKIGKH